MKSDDDSRAAVIRTALGLNCALASVAGWLAPGEKEKGYSVEVCTDARALFGGKDPRASLRAS